MFGVKNFHHVLLLAGAVIAFASQVDGYVNCQSTSSIEAAYKACLHEQGIDIKMADHQSASLEEALVSEQADVICSYPKDSYRRAMECIGGVTRQCMPEDYRFLLPEPRQWGEMLTRICDHHQDLDLQCASRQSHSSQQCGQRKAQEYLMENGQPSKEELKCWAFVAEFDCTLELYTSCNCQTVKVYSDIVLDIMIPSSCPQKRELEARRIECDSTQAPTTPIPVVRPEHVTADCSSATALKGNIVECFTNEGIHDDQLFNSFKDSSVPPNTVMETLLLHYGDSACSSQKLLYKEALRCTFQLLRDCTPATYQKFLPGPELASAHVDYMCEHRKDIDLLCVSKKTVALQSCAKRKAMDYVSNGGSTFGNALLCFAYTAEFECSQEVYKACGCETAMIYSDMSLELRYPKTCPKEALEGKRLHCQSAHVKHIAVDLGTPDSQVKYDMDSTQCLESRKQDIISCYGRLGFEYDHRDEGSRTTSHIFYGSILDSVMSQNSMCGMIDLARSAVSCEAEIIHYCLSAEDKAVFKDPHMLVEVFDSLCNKWQDIDITCASQQLSKFGRCLQTPVNNTYRDLSPASQRSCRAMNLLGDCAKDNLLTCGCPTARAYSDVIFDVMMPSICQFSDDHPQYMKCSEANPYVYEHHPGRGNGANRLPCAVWSLAIALFLATLFASYL